MGNARSSLVTKNKGIGDASHWEYAPAKSCELASNDTENELLQRLSDVGKAEVVVFRALYDDTDFCAPVTEMLRQGGRVLAIGPTILEWVLVMSKKYSKSIFECVETPDMPCPPHSSANVVTLHAKAIDQLVVSSGQYDYVMIQSMVLSVTSLTYDLVLAKASDALRPGGFIEVAELDVATQINSGPFNRRIGGECEAAMFARDIDPAKITRVPDILKCSGRLLDVTVRPAYLSFRKNKRHSKHINCKFDDILCKLAPICCDMFGQSPEQFKQWCHQNVLREMVECDTKQPVWRVYAKHV